MGKKIKMKNRIIISSVVIILLISVPLSSHSKEFRNASLTLNNTQPEKDKDEWFALDKFFHVAASASITGLSYHYYHCQFNNPYKNSVYFSISVAGAAGIGKEFIDKKYRKTGWSWKDITADAFGIALGYILFIHIDKSK